MAGTEARVPGGALTRQERLRLRECLRLALRVVPGVGDEPMRLSHGVGSELSSQFERWLHRRFNLQLYLAKYITQADSAHETYVRQRATNAIRLRLVDKRHIADVAVFLDCDESTVRKDVNRVLDWFIEQFDQDIERVRAGLVE